MAKNAPTVERMTERTFLVLAYDGAGSAGTRDSELDGHLDYIEKHNDRYLTCGPMHNPDKTALIGSFFLVVAEDEDDARSFLARDPYLACGMYETVNVHEVTVAAGRWMGGVIWESADAVRANAS